MPQRHRSGTGAGRYGHYLCCPDYCFGSGNSASRGLQVGLGFGGCNMCVIALDINFCLRERTNIVGEIVFTSVAKVRIHDYVIL